MKGDDNKRRGPGAKVGTRQAVQGFRDWGRRARRAAEVGVEATKASGKKRIGELLEGRTGLVLADSVERLQTSNNPLIRMETQKVPQNFRASFLYAAAAAGMFQNADEVTRVTRALMDDDKAVVQQWLRKAFNPEQAADISAWMDRVPGSEVAGGFGHRLFHGHDVQAMLGLIQDHGAAGAGEWANHVWLRDFWTPHGVPYLPAGSESAYQWLTDMGVAPSTALSLLSVNAAEAASGLFAFYSVRRMVRGADSAIKARRYRQRLAEIERLVADGHSSDALTVVDEVDAFWDAEVVPNLRMDLAIFCLGQSQSPTIADASAWGMRAFLIASNLCRASRLPTEIPYLGDTRVSFKGLAATVMAAAYSSQVQRIEPDWGFIAGRLEYGIREFLKLSEEQVEGPKWQLGGKRVWGYRPFSALTNQLLALELVVAYGSLCGNSRDPVAIRSKMADQLSALAHRDDDLSVLARVIRGNLDRIYPHSAVR